MAPLAISFRWEWAIFLSVVVVDDSADYREMVRLLLAASDVNIVGEAANGEEALAIVQRERPDIVITDLVMPRLNGIELTRHIRKELPGTMVIVMSSYTENAYRMMASDSGADLFVSKGLIYDALRPAIRELAARHARETLTLGDVLYANKAKTLVSEKEWVGLVRATAGGDQSAMQALYTRTHRIVLALIVRITNNREVAEGLMADVFHDVWRSAPGYHPAGGSVLGWIMNQARSRAIDWLRIASEKGQEWVVSTPHEPLESEWEEVAPGISCNLLATDAEKGRVSMLVRLAPGAAYPPHRHAEVEELYLLEGELMIDDKTLYPGDYNRAEPGTGDQHVWSETGCTCVLLTSTRDVLR